MPGSRVQDIILRDTRANQPDAADVSEGAIYYVMDEEVTERSNGTTWDSISDSGANDAINQLTGDVTAGPGAGSVAATIPAGTITNAKMADVPTNTFKGRTTAGTGVPEDLTGTQATENLDVFTGDSGAGGVKGLVPAPAAGDAAANKFLNADGTFKVAANPVRRAVVCSVNDAAMETGIVGEQTYIYEASTIIGWHIVANAAGDVEFDIQKTTFANYDASFASIVASAPPELVSVIKNNDSTLTGWTLAVAKFDVIRFILISVDPDITRLNLVVELEED